MDEPFPARCPAGRSRRSVDPGRGSAADAGEDCNRIRCYERNPRRLENPQYDRIMASIRTRGMDQPLFITCRPGESDYIVQAGGNTRLRILKELHARTGEARYARVHCLLRPWTCESDVLLAHLCENELRGSLPFIDKAQAVLAARALLEEEQGQSLTQRALEARLRERGYSITHGRISLMEYAVTTLMPWIPQALQAGLGKLQVARIRALHRAGTRLWKHYCPDCETPFDELFAVLCRRYDGEDWDGAALQGAVEVEIALEAELGLHTVRTALDAELQGRVVTFPAPEPEAQEPSPAPARAQAAKAAPGPESESESPDPAHFEGRDLPYALAEQALAEGPDLKQLRQRIRQLAGGLGERAGFGGQVRELEDLGCGFVLDGVPPEPGGADEEEAFCARMLWSQLAACAEMTQAPAGMLCEDTDFCPAIEVGDLARLWRSLHEQDWNDLVRLMDAYRRLHLGAAARGQALWERTP